MVPFSSSKDRIAKAAGSLEERLPMSPLDALGSRWCRGLNREEAENRNDVFVLQDGDLFPLGVTKLPVPSSILRAE